MLKIYIAASETVRAALTDRKGVSSLEYGVIAAAVIAAVVAGAATLSGAIGTAFTSLAGNITNAIK